MTPCRPSGRMRSSRIDAIEIVAVEAVEPGAELAGHLDRPVSLQVLDLRAGHGLQHVFQLFARAAAGVLQRARLEHPDALLVQQAVEQVVEAAGIVHQLVRSEEHTSEIQSLMRVSLDVFRFKTTKHTTMQNMR